MPGTGWRFDGIKPARRAVLTANPAIVWSWSGGPVVPAMVRLRHVRGEDVDLLEMDGRARRRFRCVPHEALDGRDGDGVEGEAPAQVGGGAEPAVLDPRPGLDGREPLLDQPPSFVPPGDAEHVLFREPALGGQQRRVEGPLPAGGLFSRTRTASMRSGAEPFGRSAGGTRLTNPACSSSLAPLRPLRFQVFPAGLDVDRLPGHDVKPGPRGIPVVAAIRAAMPVFGRRNGWLR